jgi:hypothetical protein
MERVMPYTEIKKEMVDDKEKWCFHNKETGQRICSDTEEGAKKAMAARYAHENQELKYIDPKQNPWIKI